MDFKGIVRFPCFSESRRKGISKTLLIMKLTFLILLIACLQVGATGYSQKLTVSAHEVPLEKIFHQIEKQSGYRFWYDQLLVKDAAKVTIDIRDVSLEEALNQLLEDQNLTYTLVRKTIVIKRKPGISPAPILPGDTTHRPAQLLIKPKGVIFSESGDPLDGATVAVKGGNLITHTNNKGEFELPELPAGTVLTITFIGYAPRHATIRTADAVKLYLSVSVNPLDEKVVQGYGTTSRRLATGSLFKIDSSELERRPVNDPIAALQGLAPGLMITSTSGLPGASVTVQIRGVNSLKKNLNQYGSIDPANNPLYIVDGVPFISQPLNAKSGTTFGVDAPNTEAVTIQSSPFKSINPADIESIEILKDADATAIYGARGANGVILITTKRGKAGKTRLNLDAYTGISVVPTFFHMLNTQQYLALRHEAFNNDQGTPSSNPNSFYFAPDLLKWDTTAYTDWQKKYAGNAARTTNAQATLSGGDNLTRFLVNAGYRKQTNVFPGDFGLRQGSFRMNLDHNSADRKFTMNLSAAYSADLNKLAATDPFSSYNLPPNFPIYNKDGSLNWDLGVSNPQTSFLRTYQDKTNNLLANLILGYQLLPGLRIKSSLGYNKIEMRQLQLHPSFTNGPNGNPNGIHDESDNSSSTILFEPQIDYSLPIGSGVLQALAGGTLQQNNASSVWYEGSGYTDDDLLSNLQAAATTTVQSYFVSKYNYQSLFGRLNYNWRNKYIVNMTLRKDGSSRFGPGKQFGTFGAAGAAWIFTEEPWMKSLSFLSFGKLRGSYGITGNDQIGDYQYYNTYTATVIPYQTSGLYSTGLYNPDYRWETNKKLEAAVELGLFNNRVMLITDYYRNRSGNQLVSYPLASQTGGASVTANLNALVQNSGFEFDLKTTNIKTKDFTWISSFNISFQRNKLLRFPGLVGSAYQYTYVVGKSISNLWGYIFDSVDRKTGISKYKDLDHDGVFTSGQSSGDRTIITNSLPDFYGGFNNSFSYKNFQLDIFFNFRKLDKVPYYLLNGIPGGLANEVTAINPHWQKPGDMSTFPQATSSFFNPAWLDYVLNFNSSTRVLVNGSYIRLSNLSLSYTLPARWLQHIKLQQVRLYMLGQNIFTITHYPGPDPQTGSGMPTVRTITGGVKIDL